MGRSESSRLRDGTERRQYGRFSTALPAMTLREDLIGGDGADRSARCQLNVQDFSLGGFKADSPIRLKLRERLTLRLLPNGILQAPLEMTGRVVHCRRQDTRYEVGIEFCQTHPGVVASPWLQLPRFFTVACAHSQQAHATPQ